MSEEKHPYEVMNEEPYEVLPEGPKHAVADWLTGVIATAALILGIAALAWPERASANEHCSQWAQGFELGYCWRKAECYIPPQICPRPDGNDPYMAGLKAGLEAQKEWI